MTRGRALAIATALLALGLAAGGVSGTWASAGQPAAFRALDASRPITYFIGTGNARDGFHAADPELARWALEAWQRSAAGAFQVVASDEQAALIRVYWAGPNDGQYGEMRPLLVDGRPAAAVFIRPDTSSLGDDIARGTRDDVLLRDSVVYLTCLHEIGHALGLRHTSDFRDIMYFFGYGGDIAEYFGRFRARLRSRNDLATTSALSAGDIERLVALYPRR